MTHPPTEFVQRCKMLIEHGQTIEEAVRKILATAPTLSRQTMDHIGSWPSSDPMLRELQRQY